MKDQFESKIKDVAGYIFGEVGYIHESMRGNNLGAVFFKAMADYLH